MKSFPDLSRELEVARTVALEAAALVARFAGRPIEVRHKHGGEPVSQADLESSAWVVRRLGEAFPDDAILSEELPDDSARLTKSRVWMIDPIDGTRDFLRGESGYAVMIGLCLEGRPALGVVIQPATSQVWLGMTGVGAWKEEPGQARRTLRVSSVRAPSEIRLVSSKSHRTDYYKRFRDAIGARDDLSMGSVGLKISTIAQGSRDLYVYPGRDTKLWDSCGPDAILTAAGGMVTDTDGNPLCYGRAELRNLRGIVASNGLVHDAAIETVARLRAEISQAHG